MFNIVNKHCVDINLLLLFFYFSFHCNNFNNCNNKTQTGILDLDIKHNRIFS